MDQPNEAQKIGPMHSADQIARLGVPRRRPAADDAQFHIIRDGSPAPADRKRLDQMSRSFSSARRSNTEDDPSLLTARFSPSSVFFLRRRVLGFANAAPIVNRAVIAAARPQSASGVGAIQHP